jgi:acyl-CoA dehydrogenase
MDLVVPDHIVELERTARRAFADLGGVDFAREAEADLSVRARAGDTVRSLGAFDIDPLAGSDEALAAFALCREAGRVALPWPLESTLCRHDGASVVLVDADDPLVDHGDLLDMMTAFDLGGRAWRATTAGDRLGSRLAPFAVPVTLEPVLDTAATVDAAGAVTAAWALSAVTVLGYVEASVELAAAHVRDRHQFGQRIADFQAVQFQVADAVVAAQGLAELARFTLWRVSEVGAAARTDALALRVHAADVARAAMRTAQQLHGAAGVSDEYDVSVLCRRVQAALRLPVSSERVVDLLVDEIRDTGFASLFPHGRDRPSG